MAATWTAMEMAIYWAQKREEAASGLTAMEMAVRREQALVSERNERVEAGRRERAARIEREKEERWARFCA